MPHWNWFGSIFARKSARRSDSDRAIVTFASVQSGYCIPPTFRLPALESLGLVPIIVSHSQLTTATRQNPSSIQHSGSDGPEAGRNESAATPPYSRTATFLILICGRLELCTRDSLVERRTEARAGDPESCHKSMTTHVRSQYGR